VLQEERTEEDKVCNAGCRIGEPVPPNPAEISGSPFSPARRSNSTRARSHPLQGVRCHPRTRCRTPITGTAYSAQIPASMRTLYRIQLPIHLLYPLLVFMIIRRCHRCTHSRLQFGLHRVKASLQFQSGYKSLTIYTSVSRHRSNLSVVAHSHSHAQPQYFNTNGFHSPSPNPPPYTEYATELNCPQPLQHQEGESSYWTTIGGDSSRYTEGQSNRWVFTSYVFCR